MLEGSFSTPYRLGHKVVHGRLAIPSGIRCTHASTIVRCFAENPAIGVITTKSIGAAVRPGYREPIYARYAPGCYVNAVGLANPGAAAYLEEFEGLQIPEDKFLLVSIIGTDVASFVQAAKTQGEPGQQAERRWGRIPSCSPRSRKPWRRPLACRSS